MKRMLCLFVLLAAVMTACGGSGVPLVSGGETGTVSCNYPTTVPGGPIPDNLCADADIIQTPQTTEQPGTNPVQSECGVLGAGGYPVVWASTFWNLGEGTPSPMPRCDEFDGQDLTSIALAPTSSGALGFDGQQVMFKANRLTGGGSAATFALTGPDDIESVTFRANTWSLVYGDPATNFESACAGRALIEVRGTNGCIDGADHLVWLESDAFMKLIGPSFDDPATFTWINSWTPAD